MDVSKLKLRKFYIDIRKTLSASSTERSSLKIAKNIFSLPRILESDLIMVYHKLGSEVSTATLIDLIIGTGRGVALPYIRSDGTMGIGRVFNPRTDLITGPMGIMEPLNRLKDNINANQLGAVVCPGLAFDENLTRLGRGGGHYDRFLSEIKGKTFIIGCAFDCQISYAPLPHSQHDVPMDAVITERRAFPTGICPAIKPPAAISDSSYNNDDDRYAAEEESKFVRGSAEC
jgi:5-formyltetrahydrofolate cyclo-ligase